jgi:hypothetical protein
MRRWRRGRARRRVGVFLRRDRHMRGRQRGTRNRRQTNRFLASTDRARRAARGGTREQVDHTQLSAAQLLVASRQGGSRSGVALLFCSLVFLRRTLPPPLLLGALQRTAVHDGARASDTPPVRGARHRRPASRERRLQQLLNFLNRQREGPPQAGPSRAKPTPTLPRPVPTPPRKPPCQT